MPDETSFTERLKWLRTQSWLTQEELGKRCGVTKGYISRLEKGQRKNPGNSFLRACCDVCQVPQDWLAKGIGPRPTIPAAKVHGPKNPVILELDLKVFMRMVLDTVPVSGEVWLQLIGQMVQSKELSSGFKQKAMLAANLAYVEKMGKSGI